MQIFSDNIGIEFGQVNVLYQRGKTTNFDGISLSDGRVTKGLIEGAGQKYLDVLQADQIRYTKMKEKVKADTSGEFQRLN